MPPPHPRPRNAGILPAPPTRPLHHPAHFPLFLTYSANDSYNKATSDPVSFRWHP